MTKPAVINPTESDERSHLGRVRVKIKTELDLYSERVGAKFKEALEIKKYLNEHRGDMDHAEKIATRNAADQATMLTDHGQKRRRNLEKLHVSPYFGRIDFQPTGHSERQPIYVGIHSFYDSKTDTNFVYDWRAPVSSMFYHHETGPAGFDAPEGRIDGEVVLKRQYKIERGELLFMLETAMNIHDDVLQRELSQASDEKMKNIVATIQRDQNAIIRDDDTHALIIQGVAGSGKTSIALHRIAYLLYRYKETISSEDILIISPNKVFAHYISQVLPELGEEMIKETTMEALADQILAFELPFQTFAEQVATLLNNKDDAFAERIRFKSTPKVLSKLEEYALLLKHHNARADDVIIGKHIVPASWITAQFRRFAGMPVTKQVIEVTEAIVERMRHERVAVTGAVRTQVRTQLQQMMRYISIEAAYQGFYDFIAEPEMFVCGKKGLYEWADVFPLIYLKMQIEGTPPRGEVKHLVVDEMQDYSAVQYRVICRLFPCKKTILGDCNQSVNPLSSTSAEVIEEILPDAGRMTMNKSYRSTVEITRLALRINPNPDIVPIERHGEEPQISTCADEKEEIARIREIIQAFATSGHKSLGIICKTQAQADALHKKIRDAHDGIHLLNARSTVFSSGIILATAHLAKGLEFDQVIAPHCSAENYHTNIDRQMLYVACTRAMHRLHLTHTGGLSTFLK